MAHCQEFIKPPDLVALHQYKPDRYPYLLASNTSGEINTRYSILMAFPEQTILQGSADDDCLQNIQTSLSANHEDKNLPFIGGWFVFLCYEYASLIEPSVRFHTGHSTLPLAFISRIPAAILIDHELQQGFIVARSDRAELVEKILGDIHAAPEFRHKPLPASRIEEENSDIYRRHLQKILQYIKDGDIFQANLSRLWTARFEEACDPVSLYQNLTRTNPAPFAALIKFRDEYVLSSSPERLISVNNGMVDTRPIAGTYPRGKTPREDRLLSERLLEHPKERAEHVMLIDLERNDLGRICEPGSILVKDKMILETYTHVHHIVSSVTGKLRQNVSVKELVHAVFPGGTITGCPKVRCMQIISELEQAARGPYTGAVGYVSDNGHMDLNILIRTMSYKDNLIQFRAGAGIVSDSSIEKELTETRHKAHGLINALNLKNSVGRENDG